MTSMAVMRKSFRSLWKSERLVYTALDETDGSKDFWWKCCYADPVTRGLLEPCQPIPPSRAQSDKALSDMLNMRAPYLAVLVCLPAPAVDQEPEAIGFVVLNKSFDRCAAVTMAVLPEHQNRGYGREALNWAIDYAFEWCNVHRVSINCNGYNENGAHLYESAGFVPEGKMRKCFYLNGSWHDLLEFGMLKEEWQALRGVMVGTAQGRG